MPLLYILPTTHRQTLAKGHPHSRDLEDILTSRVGLLPKDRIRVNRMLVIVAVTSAKVILANKILDTQIMEEISEATQHKDLDHTQQEGLGVLIMEVMASLIRALEEVRLVAHHLDNRTHLVEDNLVLEVMVEVMEIPIILQITLDSVITQDYSDLTLDIPDIITTCSGNIKRAVLEAYQSLFRSQFQYHWEVLVDLVVTAVTIAC